MSADSEIPRLPGPQASTAHGQVKSLYSWQMNTVPGSWRWVLRILGGRGGPGQGVLPRMILTLLGLLGRSLRGPIHETDAAISTHPFASQVLGKLARSGRLRVPTFTYLTDMSVHPMWVARGIGAHLALHDVAADEAIAAGARRPSLAAMALKGVAGVDIWPPVVQLAAMAAK